MTETAPATESAKRAAMGFLKGACILLEEEDSASAKLEAILLGQAKCHVQVARDGASAAVVVLTGLRPAVILVNLNLPDMNGLDLARFLKANRATKDIPVVALTSSPPPYDEAEARAAGCHGLIRAPIDIDMFVVQVASHLRTDAQT